MAFFYCCMQKPKDIKIKQRKGEQNETNHIKWTGDNN